MRPLEVSDWEGFLKTGAWERKGRSLAPWGWAKHKVVQQKDSFLGVVYLKTK